MLAQRAVLLHHGRRHVHALLPARKPEVARGRGVSDVLAILCYREEQDPFDPDAEA